MALIYQVDKLSERYIRPYPFDLCASSCLPLVRRQLERQVRVHHVRRRLPDSLGGGTSCISAWQLFLPRVSSHVCTPSRWCTQCGVIDEGGQWEIVGLAGCSARRKGIRQMSVLGAGSGRG